MRPGVIVSLTRYTDFHPSEAQGEALEGQQPLDRLTYCLEELDREVLAMSAKAPCEAVLQARNEIAGLKNLIGELQVEGERKGRRSVELQGDTAREKPGNYHRLRQELEEERERLQQEISDLSRRENELKVIKSASPASLQDWQADFDE